MDDREREALRRMLEGIQLQIELAGRRGLETSIAAAAATAKAAAILAEVHGREETHALLRDLAAHSEGLPTGPVQADELAPMTLPRWA